MPQLPCGSKGRRSGRTCRCTRNGACTAEEIHNVCLFPSLDAAKEFSDFVYDKMPDIINRPEIFGEQIITDEKDNIIGYEKRLLTVASRYCRGRNGKSGLVIRRRVLSGAYRQKLLQHFIGARHFSETPDLQGGGLVAVCRRKSFSAENPCLGNMKLFVNSDAHRLSDIPEPQNELELPEKRGSSDRLY